MRVSLLLALAGLAAAGPVWSAHGWVGIDLCRTYPERMPPELDARVLPDPDSAGARLLSRYCGQCHFAPGPGQHTAAEWSDLLPRMELLMEVSARFGDRSRPIEKPSGKERSLLLGYLERHALRPLANPGEAPAAYRNLCGDCHAAPDPAAYSGADWPALLARMDDHRATMRRWPADPSAQVEVARYLGVAHQALSDARTEGSAPGMQRELPPSGLPSSAGRWLALGPIFALVVLGLGRWLLHQRSRV